MTVYCVSKMRNNEEYWLQHWEQLSTGEFQKTWNKHEGRAQVFFEVQLARDVIIRLGIKDAIIYKFEMNSMNLYPRSDATVVV